DEQAAAANAEGFGLVDFGFAVSGPLVGFRTVGLDAVAQPVGAAFGAGGVAEFLPEPALVGLRGRGGDGVAFGHAFGDVFRQVADESFGFVGAGEHPDGLDLGAEPDDVFRWPGGDGVGGAGRGGACGRGGGRRRRGGGCRGGVGGVGGGGGGRVGGGGGGGGGGRGGGGVAGGGGGGAGQRVGRGTIVMAHA